MAARLTSGRRARPGSFARATTAGPILGAALVLAMAAPALATHSHGTLDCGSAGVYAVDAANDNEVRPFEAPGPWSGTFHLEGTTRVFKAYFIDGVFTDRNKQPATSSPQDLVTCTLTSEGPMFSTPWTLIGKFSK